MMCTPVFLVLLSLTVTRATAAGVVKRSDDTDPLEVVVHQQTSLIQNLQADLQALRSELLAVKSATQVQVAFSARCTASEVNIGDKGPVIFDAVVTNVGNGYDPTTGVFTAPVPGVYLLFLNLMKHPGHNAIEVFLYKGDTVLCATRMSDQTDGLGTGTCVSAAHLQTGDRVFAKHAFGDVYLHGWAAWSSFDGALVSADH